MKDKIDQEVSKLLKAMELTVNCPDVLLDAERAVDKALGEIDEARQKASNTIRKAVSALKVHYAELSGHNEYQELVSTLAGLDMILTPGFQLAVRLETENLGHTMTSEEMFRLLERIFSDLNERD